MVCAMFYSQGNLQDNFCCKNGSRINQNHSIVNINKAIFSLNFGSCDLQWIANSGLFCDYAISSTSDSTKIFAKIFAFYFITNLRLDNDYSTLKMVKSFVKCLYFFINFKRLLRFIRKRLVQQFFRITASVIFQTNWMIYQVYVWENLVFHNAGSCYLWPQCLTLQGWNPLLKIIIL